MSKFSSTTFRKLSASWPSGITTPVSAGECAPCSWHCVSSPHTLAAARVAALWRLWRGGRISHPPPPPPFTPSPPPPNQAVVGGGGGGAAPFFVVGCSPPPP